VKAIAQKDIRYASIRIKTVPTDGSGTWTGMASTFGNTDKQGETVAPGAFLASIVEWAAAGELPPVLWNHQADDPDALVGRLTVMRETPEGLYVEGKLDLTSPTATTLYERMLSGVLTGMSIGYAIGGKHTREDGVVVLDIIDLIEVSLTATPANPLALVQSVKNADEKSAREYLSLIDALDAPAVKHDDDGDLLKQIAAMDYSPADALVAEVRAERRAAEAAAQEKQRVFDELQLTLPRG
jgi:HK97 family phage prohead protease